MAPQRADGKLRACTAHGALFGGHGKAVIRRGVRCGGDGAGRALRFALRGAAGGEPDAEAQYAENNRKLPKRHIVSLPDVLEIL